MMKRLARSTLIAAMLALGSGAVLSQDKPLAYSSYLPPTHPSNNYGLSPFFKAAEQVTKGSLKVELHPGGVLVGGKGTLSAIRDGLVDGGFVVSLYVQNEIPVNTMLSDLALLASDPMVTMGAVNETVLLGCPECLQEYKKYKTVYMGAYSTTPYRMMCKKPVATLADLAGLKMRAAGTVYSRWANALGGVPVNIPNAEAYEALERGQLDCVIGAVGWLQSLSLWDQAKNVVDLPMGAYFGGAFVAWNESSWRKIKAEDRATLAKLLPTMLANLAVGYQKDDDDVFAAAKAKGVMIRKPDPALASMLAKYKQGEIRSAAEAARKRGVKNPEPVIQKFIANMAKWEGIVTKIGHDRAKFEDALRTEIYDKVKF